MVSNMGDPIFHNIIFDVDPVPNLPVSERIESSKNKGIKAATPDIVVFDEGALPVEPILSLIFESLAAQEVSLLARGDTIDGQHVDYSPISNLKMIAAAYNSKNIINIPGTLEQYFKNFGIRLDTHVPERGTGPNGAILYIDRTNTDPIQKNRLLIDVVAMKTNEEVEIQILNSGTYLNDIIEPMEELS